MQENLENFLFSFSVMWKSIFLRAKLVCHLPLPAALGNSNEVTSPTNSSNSRKGLKTNHLNSNNLPCPHSLRQFSPSQAVN